jgi:hypothetical protein
MSDGIAVKQRRARSRSCRHHWVIESPHGATSRGVCKRCGIARRFPNAPEDNIWDSAKSALGRWSNRRRIGPSEIRLKDEDE